MSYRIVIASLVIFVTLLGGCASGVTRQDSAPTIHRMSAGQKVKNVSLSMTPEVKASLNDNIKFNPDSLATMVNRRLELNGLSAQDGSHSLNIVVKEVRVRSTIAAVMFGFMAGNDKVVGDVEVKDAAGKTLDKFEISASYALGGWGGGQDDSRMNWLYEEFSKHLVTQLKGEATK